jgi:hypothetical protein
VHTCLLGALSTDSLILFLLCCYSSPLFISTIIIFALELKFGAKLSFARAAVQKCTEIHVSNFALIVLEPSLHVTICVEFD